MPQPIDVIAEMRPGRTVSKDDHAALTLLSKQFNALLSTRAHITDQVALVSLTPTDCRRLLTAHKWAVEEEPEVGYFCQASSPDNSRKVRVPTRSCERGSTYAFMVSEILDALATNSKTELALMLEAITGR